MAGADGVIDVGRNAREIFEHCIEILTALNGEQRLKDRARPRGVQLRTKSDASG
jgi:hypothetical protein